MLKLTSYSQFVDVTRISDYATQDGLPGIEVQINDTADASTLIERFATLESKFMLMEAEQERETELIANTPALKDLYDQFKVMLTLVKEQ